LALRKVLFARRHIDRVQFPVEKGMENELPFRTGTGHRPAALGRNLPDHGQAHQIGQREHQSVPLTAVFSLGAQMEGPTPMDAAKPSEGSRNLSTRRPSNPACAPSVTEDSRSCDKIPKQVNIFRR
jgi:hypothetical protein